MDMVWAFRIIFAVTILAFSPLRASGAQLEPGAGLRVFLMTFSPGSIIYERFGHNAICIHDPNPSAELDAERTALDVRSGPFPQAPPFNTTDRAHHYGMFDFQQESFIFRFIMGRMEYSTVSDWADLTALSYAGEGRSVLLQELDLTPAQKLQVKAFLEWNERPENRMYRYDYYRDNCATRVRDVIDLATGGQLKLQLQAIHTDATFRSHTRRLTSGLDPLDVFWFTAFTYVLGHPVDQPLTAWDECFLPDKLSEYVRTVRLEDGRPLVLGEQVFSSANTPPMPAQAPTRRVGYALAGLLIGGLFFTLANFADRFRVSRIAFAIIVAVWSLFWGIGATIAANGWAFTDHAASYRNENLLQASPLFLPMIVLGPMMVTRRKRGAKLAVILAVSIAALSLLGLLLKIFPGFWQHNAETIGVMLPANIGLAAAVWILARRGGIDKDQKPKPVK
jgi:hypothetical protein